MRTLIISIITLAMCSLVLGEEITANVSQITLLMPPENTTDTLSSRIAILFDIPEAIEGKMIIHAELLGELDFSSMNLANDAMMDLQAQNITVDWNTETAAWSNLAYQLETSTFYSDTFKMTNSTELLMDVTPFVQGIADGETNYGIMLIPYQFYELSFQFNQVVVNQLASTGRLNITYDNF